MGVLLLVLLLGRPPAAAAAEAQRAVVDLDDSRGWNDTIELVLHALEPRYKATIVDLDELLDVATDGWLASPTGRLMICPLSDLTATDIDEELAIVEDRLAMLEYAEAKGRLLELDEQLCSCSEPIPPAAAYRLQYLFGLIRYYTEDPDGAREAFRKGAERTTERVEWDTTYPPEAQQTFLLGLGDAAYSPKSYVQLPDDHGLAALYIDGEKVPLTGTPQVVGAHHVLQFQDLDGTITGATLDCSEATKVELTTLVHLRSALREEGGGDDLQLALDTLAEAALEQGFAELVVIARDGESARMYTAERNDWTIVSLVQGRAIADQSGDSDRPDARARTTLAGLLEDKSDGPKSPNTVGGTILLASGAGLFGVGLTIGLIALGEMDSALTRGRTYSYYQGVAASGFGVAGLGLISIGIGVPILVKGKRHDREALVVVAPAWTGSWVGITGAW